MKIIAIHELAHSQQKARVFDSEQLYGPDGQHYVTEITSLTGAYVRGTLNSGRHTITQATGLNINLGCHTVASDVRSSSTPQNPEYNGITGAPLNCEDMISWTSLDKDDFFKIEGLIASILLEVALRIPDGFTKSFSSFSF